MVKIFLRRLQNSIYSCQVSSYFVTKGGFLVLFCGLYVYYFEKDWEKADKFVMLEKIAELAMHIESLEIEVEVPEKQREPVGEQQGSGLVSETGNLLHDERGKQTELEGR